MKKALIIGLLISLSVFAGGIGYLYWPVQSDIPLTEMLPSDTLIMLRADRLKDNIEKLRISHLGKQLGRINFKSLLHSLEAPEDITNEILSFKAKMKGTLESVWFNSLFGEEVGFALLPFQITGVKSTEFEKILNSIVIVARPKHRTGLIELFGAAFAKKLDISSEVYKKWDIHAFSPEPGIKVYYALNKGILVSAFSRKTIVSCLDKTSEENSSLAHHSLFTELKADLSRVQEPWLMVFGNLKAGYELLGSIPLADEKNPVNIDIFRTQINRFKGYNAFLFASYDDDENGILKKTALVSMNPSEMEQSMASGLQFSSQIDPFLEKVPADVLFYSWQNNFVISSYFQKIAEDLKLKENDISEINQNMKKNLGITLEELLNSLGNEIGIVFNDINTQLMFPIPEFSIFARTSDSKVIDRMMGNIIQQFGLFFQEEDYNGLKIKYVVLPFGENLSPSYACENEYCIVSSDKEFIKLLLTKKTDKSLLSTSQAFMTVNHGLTQKNNHVVFVKMDQVMDRARKLIEWGVNFAAFTQPNNVQKIQTVIDQLVNPVIEGLKMYETIGFRKFVRENRIESQMFITVNRNTDNR